MAVIPSLGTITVLYRPEVIEGFDWPQARLLREAVVVAEKEIEPLEKKIADMVKRNQALEVYGKDRVWVIMKDRTIEGKHSVSGIMWLMVGM